MRLILLLSLILATNHAYCADITTFVVQEALRGDETGTNRTSETVTVGLPLPEDGGYINTSSFGITGSTVGQFKITGWWPNGNAKWVTVDLQTDLVADTVGTGFALTDGGVGNFGGSNLATDNGTYITVDTGAAVFTIKKANFNLFDTVSVGGTPLVTTGNTGGFKLVDTSSVAYSSINDADSTASIEDNGPVKAVVVASGTLEDSANNRFCDYDVRFTFYKNKSYVKGTVSLRNAKFADYVASVSNNKEFYSSELTVPVNIGATQTVILTDNTTEYPNAVGVGDTSYVYQGHSDNPLLVALYDSEKWEPPVPKTGTGPWVYDTGYLGVNLVAGATTVQALGDSTTWTQGYADLSDSLNYGVTVGMKYMAQNFPAGFELKGDGEVSIELFSKRNNNTVCKFAWSKIESREVVWDFHVTNNDKKEAFIALQQPLIARAPFEYYRTTEAFGTDELVSTTEEAQYMTDLVLTARALADPTPTTNTVGYPWRGFLRVWSWGTPGVSNQTDTAQADFLDWVRTGLPGYYVFASQKMFFQTYAGVRYSDDFTFESSDVAAIYQPLDNMSGPPMDVEHIFYAGQTIMYSMSGDTFYKDGALEQAEWVHRMYLGATTHSTIPTTRYFRWWSRQAETLSLAYDFSSLVGEQVSVYMADVLDSYVYLFDQVEDTLNVPTNDYLYFGRNLNRGYIYHDDISTQNNSRVIWSFFHTQVHFNMAYTALTVARRWGYPFSRYDDFEDYLTGLSQFIYEEYIKCAIEDGVTVSWGGTCGFEYAYDYQLTRAEVLDPLNPNYDANTEIRPISASRPYTWYYKKTGVDYQSKADRAATWTGDNERKQSELQEQALMYLHVNGGITPEVSITPSVVNNGGGSYTLSWTVPSGISSYQIKYSTGSRTIQDWLGYDRDLQTYTYSPTTNIAFFAATNVSDEPVPGAVGTTQEYTIVGLDASGVDFAIKGSSTAPAPEPPASGGGSLQQGAGTGALTFGVGTATMTFQ